MLVKGGEIEHRAGADAGPLDDGTAGVARAAIVCRAGEGHCRKSLRGRIKKEDLDIVVWHETDPGATARRERAAVAPRVVGPARLHVRQRDRREDGACRVEDADGPLVVRPKVQLVGQGTVRGARVLVHVAVSYGGGGKGAQRNIENADVVGRMRREVDLAIEVRRPTVLVVATEWQRHIGKGVGGLIEEADVISAVGSEDDGRVRVGYAVVLALAQRCWEGGEGAQCHQQVRWAQKAVDQVVAAGRRPAPTPTPRTARRAYMHKFHLPRSETKLRAGVEGGAPKSSRRLSLGLSIAMLRGLTLMMALAGVAAELAARWPDEPIADDSGALFRETQARFGAKGASMHSVSPLHARMLADSDAPTIDDIATYNIILFSSIAMVAMFYFSIMAMVNMEYQTDPLLYSKGKID